MKTAALALALLISSTATADSYLNEHSERVQKTMFYFRMVPPEITELAFPTDRELLTAPPPPKLSFVQTPSQVEDLLELARLRDRLLLFRDQPQVNSGGLATGIVLFGATTIMAAHLPAPFNVVFEGPAHLGPTIFSDGGVGAGAGFRF